MFDITEEQKMFKSEIRYFAEKHIAPLVEEAEAKERFPLELFPLMGRQGYLCVRYPKKYGGREIGKVGECVLVEELARVCGGIAIGIRVQSSIGTSLICDHGTEEQKRKYLVPAIKGELTGAFALTEPSAGSDAAAIKTTATRDGDTYYINGHKKFINNSTFADYILVAAYTDRSKGSAKGVSILILDKYTQGFRCRQLRKLGNRSSETGELFFENCRVPNGNLIGEEGKAFPYLLEALNGGRITHAFSSMGVAQAAFEASVKYSQEREQFGQLIGEFQAISFKLANMATRIEAARWLGYRAAWLYDQGERCRREASMAKLFASETAQYVTSEAMQIHGGVGYLSDSPIQRYFRDARLYSVTEGTSEIQEKVIARELGLRA